MAVGLVRAGFEVVASECFQHIGGHPRNHLVNPGLLARETNDQPVPLHATPVRGIAGKQQVRVRVSLAVVVAVLPELERLATSDIIERIFPVFLVALAPLVEQVRMNRIVGPVGVVGCAHVLHRRNEYDEMALLSPHERSHLLGEESAVQDVLDHHDRQITREELWGERFAHDSSPWFQNVVP